MVDKVIRKFMDILIQHLHNVRTEENWNVIISEIFCGKACVRDHQLAYDFQHDPSFRVLPSQFETLPRMISKN